MSSLASNGYTHFTTILINKHKTNMKKPTKYETDKLRSDLREFILMCREHAERTSGEMREINLAHMNAAIKDLSKLNHQPA